VIRIEPAGFSRSSISEAISASICSKAGLSVRSSRWPAYVGATLRVVRASKRSPKRDSSRRMGVAQRGLRDPKLCGSARAAALLQDGDEGRKIGELLTPHSCTPFIGIFGLARRENRDVLICRMTVANGK